MRRSRFPVLELSILILVGALVWLLAYPQYKEQEEINKRYRVMVNMYTLRAAVENYAAYNEGKFPKLPEEFKPFFTPLPTNPYKNKLIDAENVVLFRYNTRDEPKESSPTSRNSRMCGDPGGLGYGYYIAAGDTVPSAYGIIGFDEKGLPLAEKRPSGEVHIFVIYE